MLDVVRKEVLPHKDTEAENEGNLDGECKKTLPAQQQQRAAACSSGAAACSSGAAAAQRARAVAKQLSTLYFSFRPPRTVIERDNALDKETKEERQGGA